MPKKRKPPPHDADLADALARWLRAELDGDRPAAAELREAMRLRGASADEVAGLAASYVIRRLRGE